jgi:hypothetical protein
MLCDCFKPRQQSPEGHPLREMNPRALHRFHCAFQDGSGEVSAALLMIPVGPSAVVLMVAVGLSAPGLATLPAGYCVQLIALMLP